jgi:hypothetical protein
VDVEPQSGLEAKERQEQESELVADRAKLKLNAVVAITIAILATFMGLCRIKDENIVLEMQRVQSSRLDAWNFYQARNIREDIYRTTADVLKSDPEKSAAYSKLSKEQGSKKGDVKKEAEGYEKAYDLLRDRHDLFDLEDAALAISVSLFAITSLTQKRWLFAVACLPALLGIVFGIGGLYNLKMNPEAFLKLLGN